MTHEQATGTTPALARRLGYAFGSLFRGLPWTGSEGDDFFHPFSAPLAPETELTAETFRAAAGLGPSWNVELSPAADWFAQLIAYFHDDEYSGDDHGTELVYAHLQEAMTATLEGPPQLASVHWAPTGGGGAFHKARYYVFGRVAEGGLAGVTAQSVET
jgi:hypothetical protein